ncbi:MAG: hypothetical protein ACYS0G_07600 [Planctomycetota bacterium]|jgi:hypothetical protein
MPPAFLCHRTWARRVVLPLVILAVAAALALWGSRAEAQRSEDVRRLLVALFNDVAAGRDPQPRLGGTDPVVAGPLISRLQAVCADPDGRPRTVDIEVQRGDLVEGNLPLRATHTAIVRLGGVEVMRLRLVHRSRPTEIVIIGFWTPPPRPRFAVGPRHPPGTGWGFLNARVAQREADRTRSRRGVCL